MNDEYVCAHDYWPLIPDGVYEAQCIKYDDKFSFSKGRKLYLTLEITDFGKHNGKQIFKAYNMPYDKKITPGYNYYKDWVKINGMRKPSRNASMSPRIFKGKIFSVKTRTVKLDNKGKEKPKELWYSVVDGIVDVIAGHVNPRTTPSP